MDQLMSELTKLRVALTTRIQAIMRDSSATGIFKGRILQTHLLHKARLRIGFERNSCLATADVGFNASGSISEYEINQATLTIAHAMVNPCITRFQIQITDYVDWDVDRFAEMAKEYVNSATKGLRDLLLQTITSSAQDLNLERVESQYHQHFFCKGMRLQDPMVTSASYKSAEVQEWLAALSATEFFWNAITAASALDLFKAGALANTRVVQELQGSGRPVMVLTNGHSIRVISQSRFKASAYTEVQ
ncbi:hypothetical protein F4604DRAFT_1686440 [Suillus subluteus]|nr:hypothetical protein F4604DRAFT_1686440 [Suillus subluteus]